MRKLAETVAVGISVTRYPPHRSVRALLTHTAPTESIWHGSVHQGMGVQLSHEAVAVYPTTEPAPDNSLTLAPPTLHFEPPTDYLSAEHRYTGYITRNTVVVHVTTQNAFQPTKRRC